MGLFSSSKSSSSTSYLTENNDRRVAVDNQSQGISGDGNSLYVQTSATDYGSIAKAIGASDTAVKGANESLNTALSVAGNATNASATVMRDVLAASAQNTREALTAVTTSNRDSLNFASTVNRDALTLAERGQSLIATNAASSLNMVGSIVDLAFKANEAQSKRLSETGLTATEQVARAYDTATGYQAEKQTADSKYLVIAGLVAVALVAMRAFGK